MWLMKHAGLSKAAAYDRARREFYQHRHRAEIRVRVAKEEALHVGAYFGKGPLEVGMQLEDATWESWKKWATAQIDDDQAVRSQLLSGQQDEGDAAAQLPGQEYDEHMIEAKGKPAGTQTPPGLKPIGGMAAHA